MFKFNYRKILFICILIYLNIFTLLKYLQLTKICHAWNDVGNIRVHKRLIVGDFEEGVLKNFRADSVVASKVIIPEEFQDKPKMLLGRTVVVQGEVRQASTNAQVNISNDISQVRDDGIPAKSRDDSRRGVNGFLLSGVVGKLDAMTAKLNCKNTLINAKIVEVEEDRGLGLYSISQFIDKTRSFQQVLTQRFQSLLTEPHASFSLGVLLGVKNSLPDTFYQELIETGTVHVVTASGYNVSIVATVILGLLQRFCSKRISLVTAMLGVAVYVILAGGSPSILRAGIMGVIALCSQLQGKVYLAKWGLVLSALLMLTFSPLLLANASFQLSVAATIGILWIQPLFTIHQSKNDAKNASSIVNKLQGHLIETFYTTLSASSMTLPIILVRFGRISVVSLVANTVLLWIIPLCMFLSFLLAVVVISVPTLAPIFAFGVWVSAEIFIIGIRLFAAIPFSSFEITSVSVVVAFVWYFLLFWIYQRQIKKL